ncbi:Uncharacterized protein TCM_024592 [Theobroma cacao]|uniref:Reverse transcriptase Ty1/copia-type domain-containing protein n=1 Tax=Theobroma cacao TaxID=3641 RepID=A0A061EXT3_THECC|nr:Uncharacterized protein TCM_024592 [Theobroma cacao]
MWYQRLSKYLIKEGYKNDLVCPCMCIKKSYTRFVMIIVYVDDMNLIGTSEELSKIAKYLKREFEVKDLGKTKLCLSLKLKHKTNGILVHQSAYIDRWLICFNMDKTHPLSTPMVVRSLNPQKDLFHPKKPNKEIFDPKVPQLNAIRALMYLTQRTRSDIAFAINLLACCSFEPT